ncbi:hypothetical protein AS188_02510 [Kocuria flava]|uniref:Uncharacterized protein n=1 Tax=Kocuria flava TaxID=446860 RepID=A0A0U3HMJ6_9MICC|nr:hypothetical protein AS188_02510 [Kocuria flava]
MTGSGTLRAGPSSEAGTYSSAVAAGPSPEEEVGAGLEEPGLGGAAASSFPGSPGAQPVRRSVASRTTPIGAPTDHDRTMDPPLRSIAVPVAAECPR